MADSSSKFTFLNYDSPDHNASHRKVVKGHISSKYRTAVRKHTEPRYALPQRYLYSSQPGSELGETDGNEPTNSARRKRKQPQDLMIVAEAINRRPPSLLEIGFTGTRVDPFNALPGQGTPGVPIAMDYYTQVHTPLFKPMFLALNVVNPMLTWTIPLVRNHEDAFHAIIAMALTSVGRARAQTSSPSKEVQFHRWKAASALRVKLAQLNGRAPDDAAVLTVLCLACLDVVFRESGAMNRHGLGLMVALRGGLNGFGLNGMIKAYLVQFDYFWMLETNSPTIFPFSKRKAQRTYPQHPFSDDLRAIIAIMPPGFRAIAFQNTLGIDVLQILARVSKYVASRGVGHGSITEESTVKEGQEYPDIFDACSCLQSSPSTEHSLEKNMCLAIILFSFNVYNPTKTSGNFAPYRGSRQELTRSLPACEPRTPEEVRCFIWIWIVVIQSWRVDEALDPRGLRLSAVLFARFDEAGSWDQVESIMRQFFWDEPLAIVWKSCWQEAFDDYQLQVGGHRVEVEEGEGSTAQKTSTFNIQERRPQHQRSDPLGTATMPPILTFETFVEQLR